jgi:hypothetical protein
MPACENCGEEFPSERWMKMSKSNWYTQHVGSIYVFCNGCRLRVKAYIPWHIKFVCWVFLAIILVGSLYFTGQHQSMLKYFGLAIFIITIFAWEEIGYPLCYRYFGRVKII